MSFGPILSILGLAPYFAEAETVVTVSKDAYAAIKYAKEMLNTPEGIKFKRSISEAIQAAENGAETHVKAASEAIHKSTNPEIQYAAGKYEWDGFEGWVWHPAGE